MLKRHWGMLATVAIFASGSAGAQSPDAGQIDRMQRQMEQLQEQMKQVKGDLEDAKKKAAEAKAAASPFDGAYDADVPHAVAKAPVAAPSAIVVMSPTNAPSICTPDQLNCIGLTSRLHIDVGAYNYRPATSLGINPITGAPITSVTSGNKTLFATTPQSLDDGVNVRRARIGLVGKFMGDWNYSLIYDFGNSSDGFGGLAPGSLPGGGTSGIQMAWLLISP